MSTGGMRYNYSRPDTHETPLFERQMGSDDFVELQQMRQVVENLQQRIVNLERINVDLEDRLEDQAKQSMLVEKECLLVEQRWQAKNQELLKEIENWKTAFQQEKVKGDRLRDQVHRSERDLYGILQKKYELMRGPGTNKPSLAAANNTKAPSLSDVYGGRKGDMPHSSSTDWLQSTGKVSGFNYATWLIPANYHIFSFGT